MTNIRSPLSCPHPLKRQEVINQIFVTLSTLSYGCEASGLSRVSLLSLTPHTLLEGHTPYPGFSAHIGRSSHSSRAVSIKELLRTQLSLSTPPVVQKTHPWVPPSHIRPVILISISPLQEKVHPVQTVLCIGTREGQEGLKNKSYFMGWEACIQAPALILLLCVTLHLPVS